MGVGRAPEIGQGGRIKDYLEKAAEAPKPKGPRLESPEEILAEIERAEEVTVDPRIVELEILPDDDLVALADSKDVNCGELLDVDGKLLDRKALLQLLVEAGVTL